VTTARYFLKVTDNNGENAEIARDATNDPFHDGDGTIIVRSVGVAKTFAEGSGAATRRNSVAIYEARFMEGTPFNDLGSPAIVIGSDIRANFSGNAFDIIGNSAGPGVGTIDTDLNDGIDPAQRLLAATGGKGNITGNCAPPYQTQCIAPVSASVMADPNKAKLKDPDWLWDFVYNQVPRMADYVIRPAVGDTVRIDSSNIGTPSNPKITFIDGDCIGTGDYYGAGLLVITGNLRLSGAIRWDGLVLVIGKGDFITTGMNNGIFGGLVVAGITTKPGDPTKHIFTSANTDFDIRGNSNIATYDGSLANAGNGMMPWKQVAFREITNGIDPAQ